MRDDWPAQRSCAGYDLPRETGIEGLWCVGDAVKQYGNGGTQACAETAKIVTDAILAQRPRPPGRRGLRTMDAIATQAETERRAGGAEPSCLLEFRNIRIVYDNAIEAIRDVSIARPRRRHRRAARLQRCRQVDAAEGDVGHSLHRGRRDRERHHPLPQRGRASASRPTNWCGAASCRCPRDAACFRR